MDHPLAVPADDPPRTVLEVPESSPGPARGIGGRSDRYKAASSASGEGSVDVAAAENISTQAPSVVGDFPPQRNDRRRPVPSAFSFGPSSENNDNGNYNGENGNNENNHSGFEPNGGGGGGGGDVSHVHVPLSSLPRDQLTVRNLAEIVIGHYWRAAVLALAVLPFIIWMTSGILSRLTERSPGTLGRTQSLSPRADGSWELPDAPVNYGFVALRAVLMLVVNGISLVVVQSTYGWKYAKQFALVCYLPMSVMVVVFTLFIYETIFGMTNFIAAQFMVWTVLFVVIGAVWLGRATQDPRLKYLLPVAWTGYLVVVALYYFFVPVFFSSADGEMSRAAIRILLHPIIFEIATLYGRHVVRQLSADVPSPDALWTIVLPIMTLNSLFGRLLMFTMSTFTGTLVTTILLGALEVAMRLTTAKRDKLAFRGYDIIFGTKSKTDRIEKEHKEVAQRVVEASRRRARAKAKGPNRRWTVDHGMAPQQLQGASGSRRSSIADESGVSEAEGSRSGVESMIPTTTQDGGSGGVPTNAGLRYKIAFYTELGQIIGPSMIAVDSISEAASIMTMTSFIWFMRLSLRRGARIADSPGDVLISGAVQLATELVTDIICLAYELRKHGNAHVIAWRERYHRHFFALLGIYVCTTAFFIQGTLSYLCGATTDDGNDFETFYCEQ